MKILIPASQFIKRRLVILITIAAVIVYIKSPLLSFVSGDMRQFLFDWYAEAKDHGISYVKVIYSNYPPLYLYIIWILTYIPFKAIFAIKTVSIVFNFLLAFSVTRIVSRKYGKESCSPSIAYALILISPTVFLNSVMWGQCDSIMAFFTIASIGELMIGGNVILSLVLYAVGLSFKMQPIFILPLFLLVLYARKVSFFYLIIIPIVYFISLIPALLAGRSFESLMMLAVKWHKVSVYMQGDYRKWSAPNLYEWLPAHWQGLFTVGNLACFALVLFLVIKMAKCFNQLFLSKEMILKLALFFSILVPFCLPDMHQRYFFLADVLSIIYAFYFPRYFYLPLLINTASFVTYGHTLGFIKWDLSGQLAALILMALLIVGKDILSNLPPKRGC